MASPARCALFIHGVACDHSVWARPAAALAARGWQVLAPDLPGHGGGAAPAPASVQAGADWALAQLPPTGPVALIGHSWGSLIALEAAARLGPRASHLALLGTASPMRVAPALLDLAASAPEEALARIIRYAHSLPEDSAPAQQQLAMGLRVLRANPAQPLLLQGLQACDRYQDAEAALAALACRLLFLTGSHDRMTPPAAAAALIAQARATGLAVQAHELPTGHDIEGEAPAQTLALLLSFLAM